jgi:transcriptional regulator GlxA family with amidase domain
MGKKNKSLVVFLVSPAVHLLDLGGPVQIFQEAIEYGAALELTFVHLRSGTLKSSSGLPFGPLADFRELRLRSGDYVILPGMDSSLFRAEGFRSGIQDFSQWLREQHAAGATICSVCTGVFVLAASGLLDGRSCTTHWKFQTMLQEQYPDLQVLRNRLFVEDGDIYSSAGVASGIDLALHLLYKKYGATFSASVARETVVYLRRGAEDPQISGFLKFRNHLEDPVHEAQDYISQHLGEKFSLEDLAAEMGMSSRNLTRLFKKTTGLTIGSYRVMLQLEQAQQMLRENHKVDKTASACGLGSANQLRTLFKKHLGKLPSEFLRMA